MNFYISTYNILLPVIGGFIGYYIKYLIDLKNERNSRLLTERREVYLSFVTLVLRLNSNKNVDIHKTKTELNDFYSKYLLYASPKVINSFSDFIGLINTNNEQLINDSYLTNLSKIMCEMRKDLGLNNRSLQKNGGNLLQGVNFE